MKQQGVQELAAQLRDPKEHPCFEFGRIDAEFYTSERGLHEELVQIL